MEKRFLEEAEAAGRPAVLTEEQTAEIARTVQEGRAWNAFHDFVESWGLLQYLLAPFTFVFALWLAAQKELGSHRRVAAVFIAAVCATCIVLMFCRGYFTSLGW